MEQMWVKICGLTDPTAAAAVAQAGADAIGLVFAPSSRQVDWDQAAAITAALPPETVAVGVFVDASADQINQTVEATGIHFAQLHGQEAPAILDELVVPAIKAFRIRDEESITELHDWLVCLDSVEPAAVLLDAWSPAAAGGTGETFNWDLLTDPGDGRLDGVPKIILAGGLTPGNVAQAISAVHPWGVDTSSGVEQAPGVKDLAKVQAFLTAARGE